MADNELLEYEIFGEYDKGTIPNRTVSYIDRRHSKKIFIAFRDGTIWKAETQLKEE